VKVASELDLNPLKANGVISREKTITGKSTLIGELSSGSPTEIAGWHLHDLQGFGLAGAAGDFCSLDAGLQHE
jgi:hypothetical protein